MARLVNGGFSLGFCSRCFSVYIFAHSLSTLLFPFSFHIHYLSSFPPWLSSFRLTRDDDPEESNVVTSLIDHLVP